MVKKQLKFVHYLLVVCLCASVMACSKGDVNTSSCVGGEIEGQFMAVSAGTFIKAHGSERFGQGNATESVEVEGFEILRHEVNNRQFAKFVAETGYVTDAERIVSEENGGSALFVGPSDADKGKWTLSSQATWRTPSGSSSNVENKGLYPVVHVSLNDAQAYASWAKARLPTELEWEYVAQQGLPDKNDSASGAYTKEGVPIANTWQGLFPIIDSGKDGYNGIAPTACFSKDKMGMYDMIGNVWEWTSTPAVEPSAKSHIIKGGSFLCAQNYCQRYRPVARQPHETDFSTNHIGFRIVR